MTLQVYKEINTIEVVAESTLSVGRLCTYVLVMLNQAPADRARSATRKAGELSQYGGPKALSFYDAHTLAVGLGVSVEQMLRDAERYWAERDAKRAP